MRIITWKNGVKTERDMTPEEIAALESQASEVPAPEVTIEERVKSVEEETAIIRAILLGEEGDNE